MLLRAADKPQAVQNTTLPAGPSASAPALAEQVVGPQLGGLKTAHHTHDVNVFRGLFYCKKRGAYGSDTPKKLTAACLPPPTADQGGSRQWSRAIDRIRAGKLPVGTLTWPDERSSKRLENEDLAGDRGSRRRAR